MTASKLWPASAQHLRIVAISSSLQAFLNEVFKDSTDHLADGLDFSLNSHVISISIKQEINQRSDHILLQRSKFSYSKDALN